LLGEKFGEDELPIQTVQSVNQLNQEIRLSQVSFTYSKHVKNVIDKLDIRVPAYSYTAIVGKNGSGKSTIINLLMRFYEPSDGQVEMDGTDTRRLSAADIREMTGYVSQENILFNLSIKENILLGKPSATDEEVDAAAQSAGIYDWILGLPDGYKTKCGENGKTLSGGQRQRVSIARALIRKPSILVLDEAASALDPESEDIIYQSIRALIGTRTIINVTHRLSSITDAHQIILMDNGKVRDSGSHEELLSRCEMYQSMWRKQSGFIFSLDSRSVKVEVDRLRDIKLFQDLDLDLLEYLSDSLVTEFVYMGETVVEHGEEGNKFYIIARGQVEVLKFAKGEQEMKQAAILSDGDHFGEISLMLSLPRTATIRTLTPCTFLTIQRDQFQTMLDKASPQLREKLENDCQIRLVY
jgi:ATP-binding cassette subfamily B protein